MDGVILSIMRGFFLRSAFLLVLGLFVGLSFSYTHAQELAPESCGNYINGEESYPIEDCANPFGVITPNESLKISFGDTELREGGVYPFAGAENEFHITGTHPDAFVIEAMLYKKEGNDYRYVAPDSIRYTFSETGTYILIVTENIKPVQVFNPLKRLFDILIPTAYAFPGTSLVLTFEVVDTQRGPSSVLFLPGVMGSRLYGKDEDGDEDGLWEPNGNQDVRQLAMNEEGKSIESIYTRDVIDEVYGVRDMYNRFIEYMDGLREDNIIDNWKPYAYDWRYGVVNIANKGTLYENDTHDVVADIESLATSSFSGKVTIVAHSNGGLLAKALLTRLKQEGKAHLVDRVIFLASPQLGTPKAIGVLLHGYDQQQGLGFLIDDGAIRTVAKNMPGVYGLLPTQKYFEKSGSVPIAFGAGVGTQVFRTAYGTMIDDSAELTEFMVGDIDGRGEAEEMYEASHAQRSFLEEAFSDHRSILDSWTAPEGIEVIEVVGMGLNTVHQFRYEQFMERKCMFCSSEPIYKPVPQFSLYGDETVVGYSAEGYEGEKDTWYVDLGRADKSDDDAAFSVEHADFLNAPSIQTLLRNILTDETSDTPFIYTIRPTFLGDSYTVLSTHSPVTLEIVDSQGRRVGMGASAPQTDIPGSTYTELASSTYIIIPKGTEYDVTIKGTGYGSMTFRTESLSNDTQALISSAYVATITPSTTIALSVIADTFSNLVIDTNGDTVIDQELTLQGEIVVPKGTYLALRNAIKALPVKYGYKKHLLAFTNLAEYFDKKALIHKRYAKFELLMLKRIEQTLAHAVKKRQLTQAQIVTILIIINTLK